MNPLNSPSSLVAPVLAVSAVLLCADRVTGQGYEGLGFVQPLVEYPAGQYAAEAIAVGDLDSDSRADVAMLMRDDPGVGQIAINVEAGDKGKYMTVAGSFAAIAMVSEAGVDELMATDGTTLFRIVWANGTFQAQSVGGSTPLGGRSLRAVSTGTTAPGLAVIESNGTTVKLLSRSGGTWSLDETILAGSARGQVHAVERMDYDHDDFHDMETVLLSDAGVDILGAITPPPTLPVPCADALIEIVPAATTGGGRDLAVLYFALGGYSYIHVWNSVHIEWYPLGTGRVGSMHLVDHLLGDGRPDLVLGMESEPSLYYLLHDDVPDAVTPIFVLPSTGTAIVDLDVVGLDGPCEQPYAAPELGGGDVDLDGDLDVVLVNGCNDLCILPGDVTGEPMGYVGESSEPQTFGAGANRSFVYAVTVTPPHGATELNWFVYHQPSASGLVSRSPLTPTPLGTNSVPVVGATVELLIVTSAPPASHDEVFQILIRSRDASTEYPSIVRWWSPDDATFDLLENQTGKVYPWGAPNSSDPGGTVGRPRVDPQEP